MTLQPATPTPAPPASRGFTLIDLMVTVAIVGILAAVAVPSYSGLVAKGRRAEGRVAVTRLLLDQERYYSQANTYLAVDAQATASPVFKNFSGDSRAASRYFVGARACGATALNQCVEIYAVPQFGNGDPDVGTLTIRSTGGALGCSGTKPQLCWPT